MNVYFLQQLNGFPKQKRYMVYAMVHAMYCLVAKFYGRY